MEVKQRIVVDKTNNVKIDVYTLKNRSELVCSLPEYYPIHHSFPMSHIASEEEEKKCNQTLVHVHVAKSIVCVCMCVWEGGYKLVGPLTTLRACTKSGFVRLFIKF